MQQNNEYKELLLKRKTEILQIIQNLENELQGINNCDIKEDADFASCNTNNENNYLIYKQQLQELEEINIALRAIENGTYGICKMCEEPINPERLKIKPFAKYCIDCKEFIEKQNS
jgi:DnaK suppressor protein